MGLHEQIRAVDVCVCAQTLISLDVLWRNTDQLRFLCHDAPKEPQKAIKTT